MDQKINSLNEKLLETGFNRLITIQESSLEIESSEQKYLRDLFDFDNFILLGDPGMGKTYSFKHAAEYEGAIYQTVGKFRGARGRGCKGKTLYLDGLDEYRSRSDNEELIYKLADIIDDIGPKSIRISCRSADWLGAADASKFKDIFNGNYAIATLQPLTVEQQSKLISDEGIADNSSFFENAEKHGLDNLLGNPQTLKMIASVVKGGKWPESKIELFEQSCEKLLAEHDPNRTRKGTGEFISNELIDTAGAICACILISNTHSISLLGQPENPLIPSYREISFCDKEKLLSTLTRRAFTSIDISNESLTYVHRTIAEYLAARWISKIINDDGLPINRLINMLGYNGTPSSELRGLHAWIAVLINDDLAHLLIESDPLGVILYSDPSALSPSNKITLIKAIEKLSTEDPYFRSQNWSNRNLGAFSSADLAQEFIDILLNPESTHHLKGLVLDALRYGKPILTISDQLIEFLNSDFSSVEEKIDAVYVLSLMGDEQREYLANNYYPKISVDNRKDHRLKIALVKSLYPCYLCAEDISNVVRDIACTDKDIFRGEIGELDKIILKDDFAKVIEQTIAKLSENKDNISDDAAYEVREFLNSTIILALENNLFSNCEQIWKWLHYLYRFPKYGGRLLENKSIINWISNNIDIIDSIFEYSFSQFDTSWRWEFEFNRALGFPYTNEQIIFNFLEILEKRKNEEEKALDLYHLISRYIFNADSKIQNQAYEIWYEFAEENPEFIERRESLLVCSLDSWEYKNALESKNLERKRLERQKESRKNIGLVLNQIRSGEHLNGIRLLANEYFRDLKHDTKPVDTLIEKFGEDILPDILEGFQSILSRNDVPTPQDIMNSNGTYYTWWEAILAAINECYEKDKNLSMIEPDVLKTGYALSYFFPVFRIEKGGAKSHITLDWVKYYRLKHSADYRKLLIELIEQEIKFKNKRFGFTNTLKTSALAQKWNSEEALKLIEKYPNADEKTLKDLLSIILNNNEYSQSLLELAERIINKKGYLKKEQRAIWLAVGFLLSPNAFSNKIIKYCKNRPFVVWTMRDLISDYLKDSIQTGKSLTEFQLESFITCCGILFENTEHPNGGWSGERNKWDASEFINRLITQLSALSSKEATFALERISNNKKLSSYRKYSLHSLANQKRVYSENNYHQPDWKETLSILSNGVPTEIGDLFAFVHDHLKYLQKEFVGSNTDIHKRFWRHGNAGKMMEPDTEDNCRDRLIEILRPRLSAFGHVTGREKDLANHKRADIAVFNNYLEIPFELKRDIHREVWIALQNQLKRLYTIDPNAFGYGIYIVFWFGNKRKGKIPKPPEGINMPITASEMENSLRSLIGDEDKGKLEVVVLDCSLN